MQHLFEDSGFMSRVASMKANFFLSIIDFCIQELSNRIEIASDNNQLSDEEIFKQIESLDDPNLRKLFIESETEEDEKERQANKFDQTAIKGKKAKQKMMKPYYTTFKPKAPTTSYLLYFHQNKAQIAAQYNITNISEVTKVASEEWKKLKPSEKEKYYKKSEEARAKYKQAMAAYKQKYADQIKEEKRRRQSNYKIKWMGKKNNLERPKNQIQKLQYDSENTEQDQDVKSSSYSNHENEIEQNNEIDQTSI